MRERIVERSLACLRKQPADKEAQTSDGANKTCRLRKQNSQKLSYLIQAVKHSVYAIHIFYQTTTTGYTHTVPDCQQTPTTTLCAILPEILPSCRVSNPQHHHEQALQPRTDIRADGLFGKFSTFAPPSISTT